ncbi:MAG: SagB/ThcOx family dehydrogenase [Brevinematales bacterium]|nr:SagB/ThcOx family dehydrogenase [Brevinematales bacterium]
MKDRFVDDFFKTTNCHLSGNYSVSKIDYSKEYPREKIPLQINGMPETKSLFEILSSRRSTRDYSSESLSLEELSLLCFGIQGITKIGDGYYFRTSPSAGALYPIETYINVNFSKNLPKGLYHLSVKQFALEKVKKGDFRSLLAEISFNQEAVSKASCVFIWTAVIYRTISRYGNRGIRYIFMDVGHICQNLLLVAEAIGLKACPIGSFSDVEMNKFIDVNDDEETAIYLATVGK